MPASSKAQQRFFGVVKSMQKGDKPKTGKAGKIAKRMSKKDVDKYASTKHKGKPEKVKKEQRVRELIKKMVREELDEAKAKRDYKAEYKKFQSSTKSKKYRAELNAYNRKKGTYGNGDGKDASHKGGKIVGFESQSKNRGRREKSRLKKEGKLNERLHVVDERYVGKYIIWVLQDGNKIRTAVLGKKGFDNFSSNDPDDLKKLWNLTKKFKGKPIPDIATEGKLNEAKETIFDVAARVMKDKQAYGYKTKKGLVKVDMQTANLLMQVFKKVNPKMKKILSDIGYKSPTQLMNTLWAVVK